ncbi:hypothetical protein AKJ65_02025 [candidate division MSBL1 archaeon SCGC-AAA259E19]|uniref:ATP-dependent DNA ligase family profile domain-containing protein n=1 Tax=candidate division MSBL1 archaeon SCGC-AAA259E19 TaxID=1698264 RepID=A0A133UMJ8_9EURY|nr:hypothetical protein AKJ65_02025 [candidate division MSBL1 archaeon SCGC-AAA259E19]
MKFDEIASLSEKLSETDSRNEKIGLISDFLKSLRPEDLTRACRMIIGRAFPKSSQKKTKVSKKSLLNALSKIAETEKYDQYYDKYGDFGEVIGRLISEEAKKQSTLRTEENSLESVQNFLNELNETEGKGSIKKREKLIEARFSQLNRLGSKYLSKILLGSSRHGVSDGLVARAIAKAWNAPVEEVRTAYMITGDIGKVAELTKNKELGKVEIKYHRPFLPMLAEMSDSAGDIKEELGYCLCEEKLDGVRIQIHKDGEIKFYTRNLNRVTSNFPELVKGLKK